MARVEGGPVPVRLAFLLFLPKILDRGCRNLQHASEALGWPLRVIYHTVSPLQRRTFERAFLDLLYLQAEFVCCLLTIALLIKVEARSCVLIQANHLNGLRARDYIRSKLWSSLSLCDSSTTSKARRARIV